MYARLENNTVAQIMRVDPATIFDAAFAALFVECANAVEVGWLWDGEAFTAPPVPVITPEQIIAEVTAATQKRLDDFARTRNYDGILSACTYATSSVTKFAAEGQYAVTARDATWAALYAFMDSVIAGTQPMPSSFADVEPFLPSLNWS